LNRDEILLIVSHNVLMGGPKVGAKRRYGTK